MGIGKHHNKFAVFPCIYLIDKRDAGDEISIVTGTITQIRSSVSGDSNTSSKGKKSSKGTVEKIFSGFSSSY